MPDGKALCCPLLLHLELHHKIDKPGGKKRRLNAFFLLYKPMCFPPEKWGLDTSHFDCVLLQNNVRECRMVKQLRQQELDCWNCRLANSSNWHGSPSSRIPGRSDNPRIGTCLPPYVCGPRLAILRPTGWTHIRHMLAFQYKSLTLLSPQSSTRRQRSFRCV